MATSVFDRALHQGRLTVDQHASAIERARTRHGALDSANDNLSKGIGLQGYAWRNLGMQANDAATMLPQKPYGHRAPDRRDRVGHQQDGAGLG